MVYIFPVTFRRMRPVERREREARPIAKMLETGIVVVSLGASGIPSKPQDAPRHGSPG